MKYLNIEAKPLRIFEIPFNTTQVTSVNDIKSSIHIQYNFFDITLIHRDQTSCMEPNNIPYNLTRGIKLM